MKIEKNRTYAKYVKNEKDTSDLAHFIGGRLHKGDIVLLDGDLGAGKTFFAAGLATSLGVERRHISSPTYTIMKPYSGGVFPVYHWDFYRIASVDELYMADFFELLYEKNSIFIVEWASLFKDAWLDYLPRYEIKIEKGVGYDERNITFIYKS